MCAFHCLETVLWFVCVLADQSHFELLLSKDKCHSFSLISRDEIPLSVLTFMTFAKSLVHLGLLSVLRVRHWCLSRLNPYLFTSVSVSCIETVCLQTEREYHPQPCFPASASPASLWWHLSHLWQPPNLGESYSMMCGVPSCPQIFFLKFGDCKHRHSNKYYHCKILFPVL